jgi:hypothetical protein
VEAEGPAGDEADARVDRLNERGGETMLERGDDGVDLLGDAVGDVDEGRQAGAPGPPDPLLEEVQGILEGELEDLPQLLLEEVGAVQRAVGVLDPGQACLLVAAEVLGVLPKGEASAFEVFGLGVLTAVAGRVPDLATDLVEGVGGPGDDVKGSIQRTALGQCLATTLEIQLAASALTWVICAQRSFPSASKKRVSVFSSRPLAAHTRRPVSWSTTTMRYRWPRR